MRNEGAKAKTATIRWDGVEDEGGHGCERVMEGGTRDV